jgi:hypothetical protein
MAKVRQKMQVKSKRTVKELSKFLLKAMKVCILRQNEELMRGVRTQKSNRHFENDCYSYQILITQ